MIYKAYDIITHSYIIKGDTQTHPELTTYEKYASVFTSKASAYKYAWQIFKIHKRDIKLIEC